MPYNLIDFSSAMMSNMAVLLMQSVIAAGVGHRFLLESQVGFHAFRRITLTQSGQDIGDMFGTGGTRFQYQLHGHQHGFQSMMGV